RRTTGTFTKWEATPSGRTRAIGQVERSWLTCMPPWQHFKNVCYHMRMADHLGFHAAIFLTGHYGPHW
ncbi:MAG TPA: hypothetical protein VNJ09_00120, partial [Chthonomonadales bacterium]|nr:hypothetical protein [Chthonomonadales bacterium]